MALLSIFRVIQVSLSSRLLLTQREKEVVSDFVSKAEKEAQGSVGYNEYMAEEIESCNWQVYTRKWTSQALSTLFQNAKKESPRDWWCDGELLA